MIRINPIVLHRKTLSVIDLFPSLNYSLQTEHRPNDEIIKPLFNNQNKFTMKNMTLILKNAYLSVLCTGMMGVISGKVWAQVPTVTVPITCEVVVAGSGPGVSIGFGGTVGSGGIVIMPDPDNGSFTINDNGTTLGNWSLLGDLSFDNGALDQSETATISPTLIYSYNKDPRPSETSGSSLGTLARSKGRVTISYQASPCGGGISFDIYKRYSNASGVGVEYVPPIIGPECWLPSEDYTYSVDQIASDNLGDGIGIDNYYWTVTNGVTSITNFYTSADKSSITFTTPPVITGNWYLECCFGRANDWDGNAGAPHTTCVQFPIGVQPAQPNVLFASNCVPIGAVNFTADVDISDPNYNPGFSYTWSSNNPAWTFAPGAGVSTVVSSLGDGPGKVILSVGNPACNAVEDFEFQINRSFQSPEVQILGPTCVLPGMYTYSVQPTGVQANPATWTLPTGWYIDNGNGTNTVVDIVIPPGTSVGVYTISVASTACPGTSVSLTVNVKPADPVFQTVGVSPACVDYNAVSPVTYAVSAITGATNYSWTFPSTWTPPSTVTSLPSVNVVPAGDGNASGTVSVVVLGYGTCHSNQVNYTINYNTVKPNTIPPVCWNYGLPGTTVINVGNTPSPFFGTYNVSSSPAGLIVNYSVDPITGAITINTDENAAGSYNLIIEHTTGGTCLPQSTSFPINVASNGASIFAFYGMGGADTYFSTTPPGSTFIWTLLDGSGNVISHPTPTPPGVLSLGGAGTPPAQVCIDATLGGCTTRFCVPGGTYSSRPTDDPGMGNQLNPDIKVFPNPNKGTFSVEVGQFESQASMQLIDVQGRVISEQALKRGENVISQSVPSGMYILLINRDGELSGLKLEINSAE
ncbi:hypothetical protein D3C87_498940 [compost metagenome]